MGGFISFNFSFPVTEMSVGGVCVSCSSLKQGMLLGNQDELVGQTEAILMQEKRCCRPQPEVILCFRYTSGLIFF